MLGFLKGHNKFEKKFAKIQHTIYIFDKGKLFKFRISEDKLAKNNWSFKVFNEAYFVRRDRTEHFFIRGIADEIEDIRKVADDKIDFYTADVADAMLNVKTNRELLNSATDHTKIGILILAGLMIIMMGLMYSMFDKINKIDDTVNKLNNYITIQQINQQHLSPTPAPAPGGAGSQSTQNTQSNNVVQNQTNSTIYNPFESG